MSYDSHMTGLFAIVLTGRHYNNWTSLGNHDRPVCLSASDPTVPVLCRTDQCLFWIWMQTFIQRFLRFHLSLLFMYLQNDSDSHRRRADWWFSGFDSFKKKLKLLVHFKRSQFAFCSRRGMMHAELAKESTGLCTAPTPGRRAHLLAFTLFSVDLPI